MKKIGNRKSKIGNAGAFTLVELLIVISIIAILAAFIVPIVSSMKRRAYINKTTAEMAQVETAIDGYKNAYGFYPPDNPGNALTNQLYYELAGTTNNTSANVYVTLDGGAQITTSLNSVFGSGVGGFVNCNSANKTSAQNFLTGLNAKQFGTDTIGGVTVTLLVGSAGGPDQNYQPLGQQDLNPWRYVYPGVNNPSGYDLWIQLVIGGKTNLICNWSKQVQINNSLP